MKLLLRLLLTINATSWMIVIYAIKEQWSVSNISYRCFGTGLLCISVLLSFISIKISKFSDQDEITEIKEFYLADNEFLSIYLGYFFVSLSIPSDLFVAIFVYLIVFLFTFLSQTQYFNPVFLLFKYHYYHITTAKGTKLFVISKGKVIRNTEEMIFKNLRRINDTTFIAHKEN